MPRKTVTLTYGPGTKQFEIDEDFLTGEPITPRKVDLPERDPHDVIREALAAPLGSPRLREMVEGKKVCLVVSDDFRAGLQVEIGECLLEEMAAGKPDYLWIFPATGSHNPAVYSTRIGDALSAKADTLGLKHEVVMHDTDTSECVEVGTTSYGTRLIIDAAYMKADVRVYGHEAKHHYMAGYSCIDKQVIPGVAMRKTIEMNHKLSLDLDSKAGNISWHPDPASGSATPSPATRARAASCSRSTCSTTMASWSRPRRRELRPRHDLGEAGHPLARRRRSQRGEREDAGSRRTSSALSRWSGRSTSSSLQGGRPPARRSMVRRTASTWRCSAPSSRAVRR